MFCESVFYEREKIENDAWEDEDVYVDSRDDGMEDIDEELKKRIGEVVKTTCPKRAGESWKRSYRTAIQCSKYRLGFVVQQTFYR